MTLQRHARTLRWMCIPLFLCVPALAMAVTDEVQWTLGDFVAAAMLLAVPMAASDLLSAHLHSRALRNTLSFLLLAGVVALWVTLAVGLD